MWMSVQLMYVRTFLASFAFSLSLFLNLFFSGWQMNGCEWSITKKRKETITNINRQSTWNSCWMSLISSKRISSLIDKRCYWRNFVVFFNTPRWHVSMIVDSLQETHWVRKLFARHGRAASVREKNEININQKFKEEKEREREKSSDILPLL